jgi:exo-beta-1,3-glucanase (GH17 family)
MRLYGADCNQASLVVRPHPLPISPNPLTTFPQLQAIQNTKVNLSVWLGNYVLPDDDAGYTRQRDEINDAITKYGVDHVAGITVGNEFMLNYLNAHGNGNMDANSDVGNAGAQILNAKIADTRSSLASLNLGKTIPVGTSDAGDFFNNQVLAAVDYGMANVHPWFANVSVDTAASWTTDFFQNTDIAQAGKLANNPQMYIAETGWPTVCPFSLSLLPLD